MIVYSNDPSGFAWRCVENIPPSYAHPSFLAVDRDYSALCMLHHDRLAERQDAL
jgi:hypothetical protein